MRPPRECWEPVFHAWGLRECDGCGVALAWFWASGAGHSLCQACFGARLEPAATTEAAETVAETVAETAGEGRG
jgi:hypothetical protein